MGSRKYAYHSGYSNWLCTPTSSTIMKAARRVAPVSPSAPKAALNAFHKAAASRPTTSSPSGTPSSASRCSGRLCAWSKKGGGRSTKGVSVHAKLNSPKPTPASGCIAISCSVLAQIAAR